MGKKTDEGCTAVDLKCEGQVGPIGIGKKTLRFSWLFTQLGSGRMQSAYRIIVSDDESLMAAGRGNLWDSGRRESSKTHLITYEGEPLKSRTRCFWRVCVWDREGTCGGFSGTASFETGIFHASDWKATWIAGSDLLRKEFVVMSGIVKARLYATGLGYHEIFINGKKTSDRVLSPSFTDFKNRVEYCTDDVTRLLREGRNAIGITLGSGWFKHKGRNALGGMDGCTWYTNEKMAIAELDIELADGTTAVISTDGTWRGNSGPIIAESLFDGEQYDATLEREGWDCPQYDDAGWVPVMVYNDAEVNLVPRMIPPIRVVDEISPVSIRTLETGISVVDFGVNIAGWVRLKVSGARGAKIVLRLAELLTPDGRLDMNTLSKATGTTIYIVKGKGTEIYEPRFTYYGFRYMEVDGFPGEPGADSFTACIVHTDVKETGFFKCSNGLFNQIHDIMKRTLSNNMHGIPTDCCQRNERQGWGADGFIASEACMYNYDMHLFYGKWLDDIRDSQNKVTGEIESLQAPFVERGSYITWNAAYPVVVRNLYRYYGDTGIVRSHYENLKMFFSYLETLEDESGLVQSIANYADWLCLKYTIPHQVDNCIYFMIARIMTELAEILGCAEDGERYARKADEIKNSFNRKYLEPGVKNSGYYSALDKVSQTGNALPLFFDMVPVEKKAAVEEKLLWQISEAQGSSHLTTGIIGTKFTMEYLARAGKRGVLYDIFNRTEFPGWGFMIQRGATTVWERWEDMRGMEMNSHDHPALASPDPLFWKVFAGIEWPVEENGIRVFNFNPYFHPAMDSAEGSLATPWGQACIKWQKKKGTIHVLISLPPNTKGRFFHQDKTGKAVVVETGSGDYEYGIG